MLKKDYNPVFDFSDILTVILLSSKCRLNERLNVSQAKFSTAFTQHIFLLWKCPGMRPCGADTSGSWVEVTRRNQCQEVCVNVRMKCQVINWTDRDGWNDLNEEMSALMQGFSVPACSRPEGIKGASVCYECENWASNSDSRSPFRERERLEEMWSHATKRGKWGELHHEYRSKPWEQNVSPPPSFINCGEKNIC